MHSTNLTEILPVFCALLCICVLNSMQLYPTRRFVGSSAQLRYGIALSGSLVLPLHGHSHLPAYSYQPLAIANVFSALILSLQECCTN